MKLHKLICLFCGIAFLICSCTKENNPNTVRGQQIYLAKVVSFKDYNTSAFPNTSENYYYDSLGRLQSVVSDINPPPPGSGIVFPDSLIYYYHATADTLPFKAVHYSGGAFTPAEYFTYDDQTRIIKSLFNPSVASGEFEDDYTYFSNQIIITHLANPSVLPPINPSYDTMAYDGNNITQDIQSANDPNWSTYRFLYDIRFTNIQNPFNLVIINRHKPYSLLTNFGELLLNKNVPLQVIFNNNYEATMGYQYDSIINGLPGKALVTYNSAPDSKIYFYYK
jgi:hypothetical protein